jgi:hypothetical protein
VLTEAAVAANAARELPAGIVIESGTVNCGISEANVSVTSPDGTAADSDMMHVAEPGVVTVEGLQVSVDIVTAGADGASISALVLVAPL